MAATDAGAGRDEPGLGGPGLGGPDAPWRFVLAVYAISGVAPACLSLQDRRGADVCLLLHALWLGAVAGRRLDGDALDRLRSLAGPWQAGIVAPLRAVRRRLKSGPPPAPDARTAELRAKLQALEIEAERMEFDALMATFPIAGGEAGVVPEATRLEAASTNLTVVCPPSGPEDEALLDLLARAGIEAASRQARGSRCTS